MDNTVKQQVIHNLREVYDPEISVNVYDLGLIYDIEISNTQCNITMSLTSAFCPMADQIVADVESACLQADGIEKCDVNITFDPQWGPEMISEDGKLLLGIF